MESQGHYRVKLKGEWIICFWFEFKKYWLAVNGQILDDEDFDEIDPHRIDPNPDNEKTEVKLPERENPPKSVYMNDLAGQLKRERQNGWNACLDEVKRLNNL